MNPFAKEVLVDAGIIALGGVVDIALEYGTLMYISQAGVPVGAVTLNAGDAVGIGSALAEIGAGIYMRKPRLSLFGAGGLAMAVGTIVGKTMIAYTPTAGLGVASIARRVLPLSPAPPATTPRSSLSVAVGKYR